MKSAIIVVSGASGSLPLPGMLTCSASKAFVSYLAIGLNYELKDQIDVMTYEPGYVDTRSTQDTNTFSKISVEQAIEGSFRALGRESKTYGILIHEIFIYYWVNVKPRFRLYS